MMMTPLIALSFALMATVSCNEFRKLTAEERLVIHLVDNTRNVYLSRPVENATRTVPVKLGMTLTRIENYDDVNRYVTLSTWLIIRWNDYRLKWNAQDYGGLLYISVPLKNRIWYPDIQLFNGIKPDMEMGTVNAVITKNGDVMWYPPVRFTVNCDPVQEEDKPVSPDDVQIQLDDFNKSQEDEEPQVRCAARLGSWTYDASKITLLDPTFDMDEINENPLVVVSDLSARKNMDIYGFSDEQWEDASFSFSLTFRDPNEVFSRVV